MSTVFNRQHSTCQRDAPGFCCSLSVTVSGSLKINAGWHQGGSATAKVLNLQVWSFKLSLGPHMWQNYAVVLSPSLTNIIFKNSKCRSQTVSKTPFLYYRKGNSDKLRMFSLLFYTFWYFLNFPRHTCVTFNNQKKNNNHIIVKETFQSHTQRRWQCLPKKSSLVFQDYKCLPFYFRLFL